MSWIKDVGHELKCLDTSTKTLRKFGTFVGSIFLAFGIYLFWRGHTPVLCYGFGVIGVMLFLAGIILPNSLRSIYKLWMGMAFAMGWLISRVLLVAMFYIIMTSVAVVARLFRKSFLDIDFKDTRDSYWLKRIGDRKPNYEKMY